MDLEIAIVAVRLARKEAFELLPPRFGFEPVERVLGLGDDSFVRFAFGKCDQLESIVELIFEMPIPLYGLRQPRALFEDLLRLCRIVPKTRVRGFPIEFGEPQGRILPVKDASAKARETV